MTDYVVLVPPDVKVRVIERVATDVPVLLEAGKVEAWVELQAALAKARAAGLVDDDWLKPDEPITLAPFPRDSGVPADVEAANPGVRVYKTPNLDEQQWIGKCGVGFHVEQRHHIDAHVRDCPLCRRDPRLTPLTKQTG